MSKVLVTGAAGFIGSHLVELLVGSGYKVRAMVHYNSGGNLNNLEKLPKDVMASVDVRPGDITDAFAVDRAVQGCDLVFHLAALIAIPYSYQAPASYVSTNVVGTLNILEACRHHGVQRLIHTSTSETYGTAQYVPIDEQHPLVGQSPYSASKIAADKLVESYWCSFELPVCTVRPFNTYGPRQSARAVIPTIISQALADGRLALGSLDPIRDLTFVEDTAMGLLAAARSERVVGVAVNLGTGQGVSIREIVDQVAAMLNKELHIQEDPKRVRPAGSEVTRLISNNAKARELMAWSPKVDLKTGLERTIEYVRTHPHEYKHREYCI